MTPGNKARARARAWAEDINAARRRAGLVAPEGLSRKFESFRLALDRWSCAEVTPGRLVPWLPVAFGTGIVVYFTAQREPAWWAAIALLLFWSVIAYVSRYRSVLFPLALGLAAAAAGFATATLKTTIIVHPVLIYPVSGVAVTGYVEHREERARSDRIVVRVHDISNLGRNPAPERVRVAVRKGTAPAVGTFVNFKARLSPPLQPLRPGGYDFARDMYFQRIGASGYVLGAVKVVPATAESGAWLHYARIVDGIRSHIDQRIRTVLSGDRGSIASALITGKRDAITPPVNDAMYVSSLAHVLSISGYHMAVVAGIVFFLIRAGLALFPAVAGQYPIKKWAAAAAMVAATFYLLLSGAEIATQRSYIMIAIVLAGVMVDRPTLTFRTLSVAAFGVLLFAPESVVHPSFQMSFAATLALVAAYNNWFSWRADSDTSLGARVALWGGREVTALILASLVAGLATTPYAAFHFHRLAPYGVLANLAAMPVVSAWVMPMGILGLVTMPFGIDAVFWELMGTGLDWMIGVALWVTGLPGAVGRIHAFGTGPLLLATAALLVICLLRSPLRWSGAVLGLVACLWAIATPRPDLFVAPDGNAAAFRRADGRLSVLSMGRDSFAVREWLAADGDARIVTDSSLKQGVECDEVGCVGQMRDGHQVAITQSVEGFAEDCSRNAVVISPREAPAACGALLIDRPVWRSMGATTLRWTGAQFAVERAHPVGQDRPWAVGQRESRRTMRPVTREATPSPADLEAED